MGSAGRWPAPRDAMQMQEPASGRHYPSSGYVETSDQIYNGVKRIACPPPGARLSTSASALLTSRVSRTKANGLLR